MTMRMALLLAVLAGAAGAGCTSGLEELRRLGAYCCERGEAGEAGCLALGGDNAKGCHSLCDAPGARLSLVAARDDLGCDIWYSPFLPTPQPAYSWPGDLGSCSGRPGSCPCRPEEGGGAGPGDGGDDVPDSCGTPCGLELCPPGFYCAVNARCTADCHSDEACVAPAVCDAEGRCTEPPELACGQLWPFELDNRCQGDQDCQLELHLRDCCGSQRMTGVARADRELFLEMESACRREQITCSCPAAPTTVDDGSQLEEGQEARAICRQGRCTSRIR